MKKEVATPIHSVEKSSILVVLKVVLTELDGAFAIPSKRKYFY